MENIIKTITLLICVVFIAIHTIAVPNVLMALFGIQAAILVILYKGVKNANSMGL